MPYKKITTYFDLENTIKENDTCIVKIGADWCGPCRMLSEPYRQCGEALESIMCIDVDLESPEIKPHLDGNTTFKVFGIPSLFIAINGVVAPDGVIRGFIQRVDTESIINYFKNVG